MALGSDEGAGFLLAYKAGKGQVVRGIWCLESSDHVSLATQLERIANIADSLPPGLAKEVRCIYFCLPKLPYKSLNAMSQ